MCCEDWCKQGIFRKNKYNLTNEVQKWSDFRSWLVFIQLFGKKKMLTNNHGLLKNIFKITHMIIFEKCLKNLEYTQGCSTKGQIGFRVNMNTVKKTQTEEQSVCNSCILQNNTTNHAYNLNVWMLKSLEELKQKCSKEWNKNRDHTKLQTNTTSNKR